MPGEPIKTEEQVPPHPSGVFLGPSPHALVPGGPAVLGGVRPARASLAWPALTVGAFLPCG